MRLIEPVFPQLTRVGGSHAQRLVFEDTLLEAYLRAGQFDKAEYMLNSRLQKRETARDTFWLGRAQAATGRPDAARANFDSAIQQWQGADPDFVELTALNRWAKTVS